MSNGCGRRTAHRRGPGAARGGARGRGTAKAEACAASPRCRSACCRLNLAGVADVVEFRAGSDGETAFPVEYKRGKPKLHRADEVQLCAQALCLEEMTGRAVPEGALFYGETKRRVRVPFDTELRRLTEDTAAAFGELFAAGRTPPAEYDGRPLPRLLADRALPAEGDRKIGDRFPARAIAPRLGDGRQTRPEAGGRPNDAA